MRKKRCPVKEFLLPLPLYLCLLSCFSGFFLMQTYVSLCQANKIMEHRRKYERKREEKLIRERQERVKKAREEHARAQRVRNVLALARAKF